MSGSHLGSILEPAIRNTVAAMRYLALGFIRVAELLGKRIDAVDEPHQRFCRDNDGTDPDVPHRKSLFGHGRSASRTIWRHRLRWDVTKMIAEEIAQRYSTPLRYLPYFIASTISDSVSKFAFSS
jgi:hypothetical protein